MPSAAMGQTYVFVSSSKVEGTFDASKVLFGPAIMDISPPIPQLS